jgi:hypothetical protein
MRPRATSRHLDIVILLWMSAAVCLVMTLMALGGAAWGMETRLPWGLGVYPYLIPSLSVPAFLLLRFASIATLARVFWSLTLSCSVAWFFADGAERTLAGLPIPSWGERLGMGLNLFSLEYILASVFIQMAAFLSSREHES